ncbi:hypothetical protein PEC106568_31700 [Pectobacterium carotovorum subsp. carotovorum]|nr:hypothetical protein PEC106568_31700 [Pectobacterium carotovorum subsp. carotovorum]
MCLYPDLVYPRSRGEHATFFRPEFIPIGLSPLARGTFFRVFSHVAPPPVYPRSRGEHAMRLASSLCSLGLSPLAQGTRKCPKNPPSYRRFIPAGAGNTRHQETVRCKSPVYPRWRGEHTVSFAFLWCHCGLSPLARGTHNYHPEYIRVYRFIPAGAGNTFPLRPSGRMSTVYPRWRGEHTMIYAHFSPNHGLSPLARGTHFHQCTQDIRNRFIPAGAGNTLKVESCFITLFSA